MTNEERIQELYKETLEDYKFWSNDLNMHFGYFIPFKTSLIRRDEMLNEMNHQIFKHLGIEGVEAHIIDLGCGVGGTMRYGVSTYPQLRITGCTISPFQVEVGNALLQGKKAEIIKGDYRRTKLPENEFDGALSAESLCHSGCALEALQEAYRLIKPDGKFVIADAFIKNDPERMNLLSKAVYQGLCKHWNLEGLGNVREVKANLEEIGFRNVSVKNICHRVAPSILHVPIAITTFTVMELLKHQRLKQESIRNMMGSFYALLSGLCMQDFGYYLITAEK